MCHPTWLPHTKLSLILEILKFLNCSYFAKIMTRKPKIANLTKVTEHYPFLESKKWYLLFMYESILTAIIFPPMQIPGHLTCLIAVGIDSYIKGMLWSRDLLVKTIDQLPTCPRDSTPLSTCSASEAERTFVSWIVLLRS